MLTVRPARLTSTRSYCCSSGTSMNCAQPETAGPRRWSTSGRRARARHGRFVGDGEGHHRGGPRRVRVRLQAARRSNPPTRSDVYNPVRDASQNRHRVRCNRNRIPPFGPSAWPPRSSLHALVVVTAVSTRFRHRHLPQRLAESGARTSSASTNRGQRTPAHDRILAGGSGNRRSPAACCPAAVRIFWLRRHARPDEPARPRRTTRLPRRWR